MVFQIPLGLFLLFSKVVLKNSDLALLNRKTTLFRALFVTFSVGGSFFYLFAIFRSLSRFLSCLITELSNQGDFVAFATRLTRQGQFESSAELNNDSHEDSLSSISSKTKNKYRVPWGFFECRFKLFLVKNLHFAILLLMITFVITLKGLTAKTGR